MRTDFKMKKFIILFLISTATLFAQNPNLGTAGAQFLEIPVGARAAALGSAFVGMDGDASSAFWNPAGLADVKSKAAHFSYMDWFEYFDLNAASVAINFEGIGTVSASVMVFSMDEMEITTEEDPNGTGRFFDAQDVMVGLSFARKLTDRFSVGISGKLISQQIWNETASGIAFDIGTKYNLDFQNLTIAMKMSNFGPDLQFEGEDLNVIYDKSDLHPLNRLTPAKLETDEYPLPLSFQVGIGFDIYKADFIKIRGAIDAVHPNDNDERINVGTEISFFDRLFLRGGYKYNYDDEDFTLGAGANVPLNDTFFYFDYAYSNYDILPVVHRISVGVTF